MNAYRHLGKRVPLTFITKIFYMGYEGDIKVFNIRVSGNVLLGHEVSEDLFT